jgi:hypothetical protein
MAAKRKEVEGSCCHSTIGDCWLIRVQIDNGDKERLT